MATLYRKHRPQTFKEAVGQSHIKITLQNELQSGKLAHAYLFCGPRGVGKTTFARLLAKSVNCLTRKEGEFEPCNKCSVCEAINNNAGFDIVEIDAASNTGVDNVRENIISSARVPSSFKYKIFIIDEVHMLSISAFNALLKTLEEPPRNVIFILCTTETHKVPATIISRCQRFDFKRIGIVDLVKKLEYIAKKEGISVEKKILESIARHSEGHMRDAESMLGQVFSISGNKITEKEADLVIPRSDFVEIINLLVFLKNKDCAGAVALVNKLVDNGLDLKNFIIDLVEILRKMMLAKVSPGLLAMFGYELGESQEIEINKINQNLSLEQIIFAIEKFSEAKNLMKDSFIIQLPLELALVSICQSGPVSAPVSPQSSFTSFDNREKTKTTENFPPPVLKQSNNFEEPKTNINNMEKNGNVALSKNDIQSRWSEFLLIIKKYNHSLSFILRACQPQDLKGNQLCLVFKYKFHKDRIADPQIKAMVEKALEETYGQKISLEAIVNEALQLDNVPNNLKTVNNTPADFPQSENIEVAPKNENSSDDKDGMVNDILNTLGGKIVG